VQVLANQSKGFKMDNRVDNWKIVIIVLTQALVVAWMIVDYNAASKQQNIDTAKLMMNQFVAQCELERFILDPNDVAKVQRGRMYLGLSIADLDPTPSVTGEKTFAEYIEGANVQTKVCQPLEIRILQKFDVLRVPDMIQRVIVSSEQRVAQAIAEHRSVVVWQQYLTIALFVVIGALTVILLAEMLLPRRMVVDFEL
jgi:hypothetical protein